MEDYDSAIRELQIAMEMGKKAKIGSLELSTGLVLAEAHIALLHLEEAQRILDSLEPLLSKTTSSCSSGQEVALRAQIQLRRKNHDRARELFRRAFQYLKEPECQYEYARANLIYATCLEEQGQIQAARDSLILARHIFVELKNDLGLRAVDSALASLAE
jgi:tetratricopeptide (TPR) repeat protein